jgi:hypothetical protein
MTRTGLLAIILVPLFAGAQQYWKYGVEPSVVRANTEGDLVLVGRHWPCATVFSQMTPFRIIDNSTITLGFRADTAAGTYRRPPNEYALGCLDSAGNPVAAPTGPVFHFIAPQSSMGRYQVIAKWLNGCPDGGATCDSNPDQYPAGSFSVQNTNPLPPGFSVTPSDTLADRPFTLTLWSRDWDCNTLVDSAYASVQDRNISLIFRAHKIGTASCRQDLPPKGIPFSLPALAPGMYDVDPWGDGPCPVNSTDCMGHYINAIHLTLRVRDQRTAAPTVWYLREHWRKSDSALFLQALNRSYHFCNSAFSRMQAEERQHQIFLHFDATARDTAACPGAPDPWGPLFSAPALAPGAYPVFILPNDGPASKPVADDTLVLGPYFSVLVSSLRAQGQAARFRDGNLRFAVPGPGSWQAELRDADGRLEAAGQAVAGAGGEARLDLPYAPSRGFHVLSLRNASGVTHMLPVIP